jgi:phosphatidylglycerophosphate synthase
MTVMTTNPVLRTGRTVIASERATPRRVLATRSAAWAVSLAAWLGRRGVRPNAVSVLGAGMAAAAGASFAVGPALAPKGHAMALLTAAACIQLRLLCNLLDGMLAVEGGMQTPTGEIFNDLPDRLADVLILVGAGFSVTQGPGSVALGWAAAVAALFTAYVRVLGGSLGLQQQFIGPMAKQQRMFTVTVAAILSAGERGFGLPSRAMVCGLAVVTIGSVITIVRRTRRIAAGLRPL